MSLSPSGLHLLCIHTQRLVIADGIRAVIEVMRRILGKNWTKICVLDTYKSSVVHLNNSTKSKSTMWKIDSSSAVARLNFKKLLLVRSCSLRCPEIVSTSFKFMLSFPRK